MHHRIAAFLLGAWILGSLFMMFAATQNFAAVNRVLAATPPTTIQAIGNDQARQLLRDMAGQANQVLFVAWEYTQVILSAALAGLLLFGVRNRLLGSFALGLLLLTAIQRLFITPEMIGLTSRLDSAAAASRFGELHAIYGITEVLKLLIAVVIGCILLPDWRSRSRVAAELPAVKYAR